MISKSTIGAMVFVAIGLTPTFAQVPPGYYPGYYYDAAPYANPYDAPEPSGLAPYAYGYGGWQSQSAASINYNIHTPPNH